MKKRTSVILLLLISVAMLPFSLVAVEETSTSSNVLPNISEGYVFLGDHAGKETQGLANPVAQYTLGAGISFQYNQNVFLDVELLGVEKEYDTPASITGGWYTNIDDDMSLSSTGLCVNVRYKQSLGNFAGYVGAGMGMFWSTMTVTGSVIGLPASNDDKSSDFGFQAIAGIGYQFTDSALMFEYRQLNLDGNFMAVTGAESNDIGGELILLVYRGGF